MRKFIDVLDNIDPDHEIEFGHLKPYHDLRVLEEVIKPDSRFPFSHKFIYVWWILEGGVAIGWNENPSRGWSFPVKRVNATKVTDLCLSISREESGNVDLKVEKNYYEKK